MTHCHLEQSEVIIDEVEQSDFMQMPPPLENEVPNMLPAKKPWSPQFRRVLVGSVALMLLALGAFVGINYFSENAENSPLAGDWMQGNGEVYTIKTDGSGSNPSCHPKWSVEGNETTYTSDCTAISPDGEPLWTEKIYSYEFVGDVLFMKQLSQETQDGYDDAPSDILCTAWVLEDLAPDVETWETIVNATAMTEMCSGIAGLTE